MRSLRRIYLNMCTPNYIDLNLHTCVCVCVVCLCSFVAFFIFIREFECKLYNALYSRSPFARESFAGFAFDFILILETT